MCLAQGDNAVSLVRLEPVTPLSQVKHSSNMLSSFWLDVQCLISVLI